MKKSMIMEDSQKQDWQKRNHFSLRINMFFFFTFLLLSILIVRLAFLQFVEGKEYSAIQKQTTKRDITISPIRGNIYDKDGAPLAYTDSAQSLFYRMEPGQKPEDKIQLAKRLEDIFAKYGNKRLTVLSANEIIKRMDVGIDIEGKPVKKPSYTFLPRNLKSGLSNEEMAYITEHRDELHGLEVSEESTRVYNADTIAVQLIGYLRAFSTASNQKESYLDYYKNKQKEFLNDEYVGFDGLEYLYQEDLRGKNGSKSYPVNSKDQIIGQVNITKPEKGHNLYLTIQKDIQLAAENGIIENLKFMKSNEARLQQFPALGRNAVAGYAVAMEVDTGKVVAMASMPDYDPNLWTGGISPDDYTKNKFKFANGTIRERYADIADDNARAKHPSSLVPLGSTVKPLTVLVGLNEGLISPNSTYQDTGVFSYGKDNKAKITNSDTAAYGSLNPATAIAHSSNTFMSAMIGNAMYNSSKYKTKTAAIDIWDSYMKRFGLGVLTGSNLPGESAGDIYYYKTAQSSSPQAALVFASFGQEARYTPLQLAQYTAMLANHGKRYKPQFVDKITTYDGGLLKEFQPEILNEENFPDSYWNILKNGMINVGISGFDGVSYSVARKTGTSQQDVGGQTIDNAVFIAYAPADKPKLAVAVVVPEGGFGRYGAGPIARKIFDAYDEQIGLYDKPKGATK